MSILSQIRNYAAERRAAARFYRTRAMLGALPADIQKDIGYPSRYERETPGRGA